MECEVRPSGIGPIGDVTGGTHFCLFYRIRQDLIDALVPYFKAGLENNEFCICITSEPIEKAEMKRGMARAMPGFNRYLENGQMEILAYDEWYEIDGVFDAKRVLNAWREKLRTAQERGFSGLRLTGNTFWLEKAGWKAFMEYEDAINGETDRHDTIALCTYSLERCDANDILDVVATHQFALVRREGEWKIVENRGCKETKEALQSSEQFLDNVFCSIQDGISVLDKELNIIRANPVKEKWHAHAMPLTGKKCYSAFHGRSEPCTVCPSLRAIERKAAQNEIVPLQDQHGGIKGWLEVSAYPLTDNRGNVIGVIEHVRDITRRKRAEEALRENEDRFKAIFNRAALGLAISDSTGLIIDCNAAYQKMLGYNKDELLEKHFQDITYPEDVCKNIDLLRQMDEGLIDTYQIEKRYIRKDGRVIWCSLISSAIRNPDGTLKFDMVVVDDITWRKQAENELQTAKEQAELYIDLMSHDINNMNMIAAGFLEMTKNFVGEEGNDCEIGELLDTALAAVNSSTRLIGNVRKLQRGRSGEYRSGVYDLGAVIEEVVGQLKTAPDRHVQIRCDVKKDARVQANELIRDLFVNLIDNAIKHSTGSVSVDIGMTGERIDGRQYCKVSIEDNGPGVPDAMKNRIFDRLHRGDTKARGSGIGLYLVKTLADSYGGRVWVEDRVPGDHGKGAKFVIVLPVIDGPLLPAKA